MPTDSTFIELGLEQPGPTEVCGPVGTIIENWPNVVYSDSMLTISLKFLGISI